MASVYEIFGFSFSLVLSTRPEKFIGEISVWNDAEKQLEEILNEFGHQWKLNPADGAFYGPKIDIQIQDALKRSIQCATIQLDFQLPERFNLSYINENNVAKRPVIIHRAILGSVERMIAILAENFAGNWPLWLSPRQILVVPVAQVFNDYARFVRDEFHKAGFYVDVDLDDNTISKKILLGQQAKYNFILVVGEKEASAGLVNIRTRDENKVLGTKPIAEAIAEFKALVNSFAKHS